ncbi:MAG: type III-B CRISPR module-associated protein Cmr3 [Candidatus Edwardsbacteria bacterium]|nr:type III-B CRISPR module-associated protein Cmr3 [Candidatus Edwardsbacteria bacterium]
MIRIKPFDTLFFRDGRPFTGGEETWAYNLFPPLPSTVYGALRTAYIAGHGGLAAFKRGEMSSAIGTAESPGAFALKGVYIARNNDLLLPAPLDTVIHKTDGNERLRTLRLEPAGGTATDNLPLSHRLAVPGLENVSVPDGIYIDEITCTDYLLGRAGPFSFTRQDELVLRENKIGIARSRQTHAAAEGMLYQAGMVRLNKDIALAADCHGLEDYPAHGMMRLGGEAKAASFETAADLHLPSIPAGNMAELMKSDDTFKLYLATPAIFTQGWLPEGIDEKTRLWDTGGMTLRLLTAAIGSPINVGGWDLDKRRPKPMRRAVPAGSVYYFKIEQGNIAAAIERFHGRNISDVNPEQGFGLCYMGAVR